ncbi:hypothetical protein ACJ73_01479 [Blastomyces percursus]|uniref:Uncharacterized protein n=1 Tax=Blastomyces percursus TaxID=1658174 RepID=A0A1J9QF45_9EURO|nr:hypothetical protein ACJ73_01479 [Blastomyces percursus]
MDFALVEPQLMIGTKSTITDSSSRVTAIFSLSSVTMNCQVLNIAGSSVRQPSASGVSSGCANDLNELASTLQKAEEHLGQLLSQVLGALVPARLIAVLIGLDAARLAQAGSDMNS